jgi:hypothetical protein
VSVSGIKFFAVLKAYVSRAYKANTTPASPKAKKMTKKRNKKILTQKLPTNTQQNHPKHTMEVQTIV